MSRLPTLVFIPGSWHKPSCYDKVTALLRSKHGVKCVGVTLPSNSDNRNATFKNDLDAARGAILSEISNGHDTIVIAHSYGGIVGGSAIKNLDASHSPRPNGSVRAYLSIATGFSQTGWSFMDPFLGVVPPFLRRNDETGLVELTKPPRDFFYHDVPEPDASNAVAQLTPVSAKALWEGGEHAYSGWRDVPCWYIGTVEDRGLPVMAQRMAVSIARSQGATVHHVELQSSHSPFLSMPDKVEEILMEVIKVTTDPDQLGAVDQSLRNLQDRGVIVPAVQLTAPMTWLTHGAPLIVGRLLGWTFTFLIYFSGRRRDRQGSRAEDLDLKKK